MVRFGLGDDGAFDGLGAEADMADAEGSDGD